jgi:hypothetical protein
VLGTTTPHARAIDCLIANDAGQPRPQPTFARILPDPGKRTDITLLQDVLGFGPIAEGGACGFGGIARSIVFSTSIASPAVGRSAGWIESSFASSEASGPATSLRSALFACACCLMVALGC